MELNEIVGDDVRYAGVTMRYGTLQCVMVVRYTD